MYLQHNQQVKFIFPSLTMPKNEIIKCSYTLLIKLPKHKTFLLHLMYSMQILQKLGKNQSVGTEKF